ENVAVDTANATYQITYVISLSNTRPDSNSAAIVIRARDVAGSETEGIFFVQLDNTLPFVRYDTLPYSDTGDRAADRNLNDSDVVLVHVEDSNTPIRAAEFFIDAIGPNGTGFPLNAVDGFFNSTAESVTAPLSLFALADGIHMLFIHAQDSAGTWGNFRSDSFRVDRESPVISNVTVLYPAGQSRVKRGDTVIIRAQITDFGSGLDTTQVFINSFVLSGDTVLLNDTGFGVDLAAGDGIFSGQFIVRVDVPIQTDSSILIIARDRVSNSESRTVVINLGDTGPRFRVTSLDPDTIYANGQTIRLLVMPIDTPPDSTLTINANFYNPDSSYLRGQENVAVDTANATYQITYVISLSNTRPDSNLAALVIRARDVSGSETEGLFFVQLDNTAPSVRYDTIAYADTGDRAQDKNINDTDVILVRIDDTSVPIRAAEFFVDVIGPNGSGFPMTAVDGAFDEFSESATATLVISNLPDGIHTLYFHAQDTAGNWSNPITDTVRIDRIKPLMVNPQIIYPNGQTRAKRGDTVILRLQISDFGAGLDTTRIYIDAMEVSGDTVLLNDTGFAPDLFAGDGIFSGQFVVRVDLPVEIDTIVRIYASDLVRNSDTVALTIRLQDTGPSFVATSLDLDTIYANGQMIRILVTALDGDSTLVVTGDFSFVDSTYLTNGELVASQGLGRYIINYVISTSNLRPDSNLATVNILARDSGGNETRGIFNVILDNTPATSRIDTPVEGAPLGGIIFIGYTVSDSSPILKAELLVDGVSDSTDNMAPFDTFLLETRRLGDGPHVLAIRATDTAGNVSITGMRNILVDNTPPQSGQIVYPESGAVVFDTVRIEAVLTDIVGIRHVRFLVDGILIDTDFSAAWIGTWNTLAFADGLHRLSILVEDSVGHVFQSDTVTVVVDNTRPWRVTLVEPVPILSVNENVRIRVYAADTIGLGRIEYWRIEASGSTVKIGQTALAGETDVLSDYTWDVRQETDGIYRIFAIAYDRGRSSESTLVAILQVDHAKPIMDSFIITQGVDGRQSQHYATGDTIVLVIRTNESGDTVSADFSPIDSEYLPGDEQPYVVTSAGRYQIRYRLSQFNNRLDGPYAIPVTVVDSAGNSVVMYAALTLRNHGDAVPSPSVFIPTDANPNNGVPFVAGDLSTGIVFQPVEPGATLEIHDLRGNLIRRLSAGGNRYIHWDVKNSSNADLVTGYYLFITRNPSGSRTTGKVAIVR
ncbi:MAG: Ig-like domain-containing protein, partial [Candidatus Hydrogenedentota bacterium]